MMKKNSRGLEDRKKREKIGCKRNVEKEEISIEVWGMEG